MAEPKTKIMVKSVRSEVEAYSVADEFLGPPTYWYRDPRNPTILEEWRRRSWFRREAERHKK